MDATVFDKLYQTIPRRKATSAKGHIFKLYTLNNLKNFYLHFDKLISKGKMPPFKERFDKSFMSLLLVKPL